MNNNLYARWLEDLVEQVSTPGFSPTPGTYVGAKNVSIFTEPNVTIYYTTNGDNPTTNSMIYLSSILINKSMTLKAFAAHHSYKSDSSVATGIYTILQSQSAPIFTLAQGTYTSSQLISISADPGSTIYYTIRYNGGATQAEQQYSSSFIIDKDGQYVIEARAVKEGYAESSSQAIYDLNFPDALKPWVHPYNSYDNYFNSNVIVVMQSSRPDHDKIYYTTNNANNDTSTYSLWIPESITLSAEGVYYFKAVTRASNYNESSIEEHTIVIDKTAPSLTFDSTPVTLIDGENITFDLANATITYGPLYSAYLVAIVNDGPAPNVDQVKTGKDSTGNNALHSGIVSVAYPQELTTLAVGDYDWYLAPRDWAGNFGTIVKVEAVIGTLGGTVTSPGYTGPVNINTPKTYALEVTGLVRTDLFNYTSLTANWSSFGGSASVPMTNNSGTWSSTFTDTTGRSTPGFYSFGVTFNATDIHGNPVKSEVDVSAAEIKNP